MQFLPVLVLSLLFTPTIYAGAGTDTDYSRSLEFYENNQFSQAREILEKLVELEPDNSKYHHLLGKCYGRLAENSNWVRAMYLAKQTLKQFKLAVQKDDKNIQALRDLQEYYQKAPGFLGGSKKKADEIGLELAKHDK